MAVELSDLKVMIRKRGCLKRAAQRPSWNVDRVDSMPKVVPPVTCTLLPAPSQARGNKSNSHCLQSSCCICWKIKSHCLWRFFQEQLLIMPKSLRNNFSSILSCCLFLALICSSLQPRCNNLLLWVCGSHHKPIVKIASSCRAHSKKRGIAQYSPLLQCRALRRMVSMTKGWTRSFNHFNSNGDEKTSSAIFFRSGRPSWVKICSPQRFRMAKLRGESQRYKECVTSSASSVSPPSSRNLAKTVDLPAPIPPVTAINDIKQPRNTRQKKKYPPRS